MSANPGVGHQLGILGDALLGQSAGLGDQIGILQHSKKLQTRSAPRLAGAQHVTFTTLLEVDLGEGEAVTGGGHCIQPLVR